MSPGDHSIGTRNSGSKVITLRGGQTRTVDLSIGPRLTVEWLELMDAPVVVYAIPERVDFLTLRPQERVALQKRAVTATSTGPETVFDALEPGEWTLWCPRRYGWWTANTTVADRDVRVRLTPVD